LNAKVLFVDDDANILDAARRSFRGRCELDTACDGPEGLAFLESKGPYAVVVADMAMPGMNGIEFLKRAQDLAPDTVRIMFTGHPGPLTLMEAINNGQVFRFIAKPCQSEELVRAVEAGLRQYRMIHAERDMLESTLTGSVEAMTGMLEVLDPVLFSSARNLALQASRVGRALGVRDAWSITLAALFTPLWLLPLPPEARTRALAEGLATPGEDGLVAAALEMAADLILPIPRLEEVAHIIRCLGRTFDGGGFPGPAMEGRDLPLGARILRPLLDLDAALTRHETREAALAAMRHSGVYDPQVLDAMAPLA
jgi:response regulator RpfG family c-di-GMP phosphodiesterase